MSKPKTTIPIKPIDFDAANRAVDTLAITRNIPSLAFPQATAPIAPAVAETRPHRLNLDISASVMRCLKQRALEGGTTVRAVVLHALASAGVPIPPDDLYSDGRRMPKHRI
jgi:hypothetical protein